MFSVHRPPLRFILQVQVSDPRRLISGSRFFFLSHFQIQYRYRSVFQFVRRWSGIPNELCQGGLQRKSVFLINNARNAQVTPSWSRVSMGNADHILYYGPHSRLPLIGPVNPLGRRRLLSAAHPSRAMGVSVHATGLQGGNDPADANREVGTAPQRRARWSTAYAPPGRPMISFAQPQSIANLHGKEFIASCRYPTVPILAIWVVTTNTRYPRVTSALLASRMGVGYLMEAEWGHTGESELPRLSLTGRNPTVSAYGHWPGSSCICVT
ncbi:hypothetical protein EVAR_52696_1 [Eumeta japonica]|uniref:Uncharacterized protein n=1 Tax=Eumeta variegata TaxID=151549 RepID=A0A4C1Y377_EUMVA|nr:hypothetical protein EVAR_52696_1 [Eumeta japonica]